MLVGDSWWQLLLAVPVALLTVQSAFFGHDAGHQQIARTRRANRFLGLLHGNLLMGMSYAWWANRHNRHHANPNHVGKDPDVAGGDLVWTREQATGKQGSGRWLARHQAWLFFPLLLLLGIVLRVSSVQNLPQLPRRSAVIEAVLLATHVAGYLTILLVAMSPLKAAVFIAVHQGLLGLHLGSAFAPNHKGMAMPEPGERWGHLRRQVLTSRNVHGGPVVDWFLGGLNYQIEHHLFPNMPRPNLRRAQPLIREHCDRLGLSYTETGLLESYAQSLRHLHSVGDALRIE